MEDKVILKLDNHPFFIGPISDEDNLSIPKSLPFKMVIDEKFLIPRLLMTDDIKTALKNAYDHGSMASTPLGESKLASLRMHEFINKITEVIGGDLSGKSILEIGCGNGELLFQLQKRGAKVKGLEIGPQAALVEKRYGISVINEPLKKGSMQEKFDCIFSYGCLEHIDEIEDFFDASRSCLYENGLFFHSVPNSELSFKNFHIDHLLHEHINYFTPKNGTSLLESQGFLNASFSLTSNQNELMLWGYYKRDYLNYIESTNNTISEIQLLQKYSDGLSFKFSKTKSKILNFIDSGYSIGFYAGGFEYGFHINNDNIRYFDGDEFKFGKKWLRDLPKIESPDDLLNNQVDKLIIFKPHYFKSIFESLLKLGINPENILNIEDLG